MANKQSLPTMNETKSGFINTNAMGNVIAPEYKEQKWATVARLGEGIVGVSNAYKNLKHTEMMAKIDNLAQQNLHKLSDATDPCELPDLINEANKSYDDLFKDDPYGKSFYESDLYSTFKLKNEANVQKTVNALNHQFSTIQATKTGNEISSDIALMNDPVRMSKAIQTYFAQVDGLELSAADNFKIKSEVVKNSFGKLFTNDPNLAVAWYDASKGMYDQYGVDGADIKEKAKNYNKALAAEKRTLENYEYTKKTREQTAKANYYKAQYLQNPSQKDVLLTKALAEDDKVYVDLSEFIRRNTPKASQRSELSKGVTNAYVTGGVAGADSYVDANPEVVNDPNAMSAYENIKKLNKPDSEVDELLKGMEKAFAEGNYETYRQDNLASILAVDKTRSADTAYRNELKVSSNADGYTLQIANSSDIDEIKGIANEAFSDVKLTDKEKASIAKYKNTRINQIENKASKQETKKEKALTEEKKEKSAQALGRILATELEGSEAFARKAFEERKNLISSDRNKVISKFNALVKAEGKEDRDLSKELQEERFNELMGEYRDGTLTQEKIDEAYKDGDISVKHKEKLENTLYKAEIKQAEETKKQNKELALQRVYTADANGETVDVSKLPSQDADVIKAANSVNLKNGKRKYYNAKNEIFSEMLVNPYPTNEQQDGWVNRLTENSFMGNAEIPEQWVANSLQSVRNIDVSKLSYAKNKIDTLFGTPLVGGKFSDYENELKNLAQREVLSALSQDKEPNFEGIISKYKPTKEGLLEYNQTRDNAYFGQLGVMSNIFEKQTITTGKSDNKTQTTTFLVKKGVSASDYINYAQTIRGNKDKGYYTDAQYKELYKPIVINEGYIFNTLAESKTKTIEAAVARRLKELNGNQIGNPSSFSKDFWECMSFVEEKGKERGDKYWFIDGVADYVSQWYKNTKSQAPNTISE